MHSRLTVFAIAAAATLGCKPQVQTGSPMPAGHATIRNASGAVLGTLNLTPGPTGIRFTGTFSGLPAGTHGIHLHAVGKCEGSDFASAGGHYNPAAAHHGLENPQGPHAGDFPNIVVGSNGSVNVDLTNPRVTLDASTTGGLFDTDGTAIVVHAAADDQKSDPSGNSGARIACGVIEH